MKPFEIAGEKALRGGVTFNFFNRRGFWMILTVFFECITGSGEKLEKTSHLLW